MKKFMIVIIILSFFTVIIQTVRIGTALRMIQIYADEQGLHHVYFTEPGAGKSPVLLGE